MTEDFDLRDEAEQPSDGDLDRVLRPARFDDFTGQKAAMENLEERLWITCCCMDLRDWEKRL